MLAAILALAPPPVGVALVADPAALAKGGKVTVALSLEIPAGWHTYWSNPGDSGAAPTVKWRLPKGAKSGPLRLPAPKVKREDELTDYVYEGTVVFLADLELPPKAKVAADVDLLVCAEACVPWRGSASLTGEKGAGERIAATAAALPRPNPALVLGASVAEGGYRLTLSKPANGYRFLSSAPNVLDHASDGLAEGQSLFLKRSPYANGKPTRLRGVLLEGGKADRPVLVDVPIK